MYFLAQILDSFLILLFCGSKPLPTLLWLSSEFWLVGHFLEVSLVLLDELLFVELDDADHGLAFDLRVVVDDHVQAVLHCADPLTRQLLHLRYFVLFQVDVLRRRYTSFLVNARSLLLDEELEGVGEGKVAALLLNASLDDLSLIHI